MTKLTITCVLVNCLIVSSLADTTTTKLTQKSKDSIEAADPDVNTTNAVETPTTLIQTELEQSKNIISIIDNLLVDSKELGVSLSKRTCSTEQITYSDLLNKSLKPLVDNLVAIKKAQLSEMNVPDSPNLNGVYDEYTNISDFRMTNLKIKGLENIHTTIFNYSLCELSSEFEISIPKIEITGIYILSGVVDDSIISGNGSINLTFDNVYAYDDSFQDCDLVVFLDDVCKFSNRNRTTAFEAEKLTVNMSGIKYKDLSEKQINDGINEYTKNYIASNKYEIMEKITNALIDFKHKIMRHLSPASLLKKLKNYLGMRSIQLKTKQKVVTWKERMDLVTLLVNLL